MITVLNINTGNVDISIPKILKIIFLREGNKMEYNIIWKIRLPRILMAAILGEHSLSGFLLQTFFENPLQGPLYSVFHPEPKWVALAMIYFLGRLQVVSSYTLIIAAFIGSLIATGFILLVSRRINHMGNTFSSRYHDRLYLFSGYGFLVTFAEDSDIVNLHDGAREAFSGMNWEQCEGGGSCHRSDDPCYIFMSKPIELTSWESMPRVWV